MGVYRLDDPILTWLGNPVPEYCNGCSQRLPKPPGLFIEWAFLGPPCTDGGQVIRPAADPDGMESDQRVEALAAQLGDCSYGGPYIHLCIPCAQRIGRNFLEDAGIARYLQGEYKALREKHENPDAPRRQTKWVDEW